MSIKNFGSKQNLAGRPRGAKNRLSWSFLSALADDFEEFGIETIRICRIERPHESWINQIINGIVMSIKNFGSKQNLAGRPKGSKNRLSWSFLTALADDFEQFGIETIRICRIERPHEYLKVVAGLMPKEFEFTETKLMEVTDDELDGYIEFARQRLASKRDATAGSTGSGEKPTLN